MSDGDGQGGPVKPGEGQRASPDGAASQQQEPQHAPLEYPLLYMFKAMGLAAPDFRDRVVRLISDVVGDIEPGAVTVRPSSGGKYESISVHVYLRSEEQRRQIYAAFHGDDTIVWYV